MDITKEQLDELIVAIKEEYAALAKSEESSPEEKSKAEGSPEASKEASKAEGSAMEKSGLPAMKKEDPMAKPEGEAPPPEAEAAPEAEAEPAEAEDLGPEDLYAMYMQLSEEHLAMHYMAASRALFSKMSEGDASPEQEEAPPHAPPSDEGAAPEAEAAPADGPPPPKEESEDKAEMKMSEKNNETEKMVKSLTDENVNLKSHVTALEAKLDEVVGTLAKVTSQTSRKAFGSDNFNGSTTVEVKEKPLTKSDVIAKLNEKARDPNLSNGDREKLVEYSLKPVLTDELKKFLEKK